MTECSQNLNSQHTMVDRVSVRLAFEELGLFWIAFYNQILHLLALAV